MELIKAYKQLFMDADKHQAVVKALRIGCTEICMANK